MKEASQKPTELMHEGCNAGTSNPLNACETNGSPNALKESSECSTIHELYNQVKDSELHVVIEKPATVQQKLPNGAYKIRSDCPGVALIINIREFARSGLQTREGSEYDATYMFNIWKGLGYKIFREDEYSWKKVIWTKEEILSTLRAFREYCRQLKPDSIVVFIGSHGGKNFICTSDVPRKGLDGNEIRQEIKLEEEIFISFYDLPCPALAGKPKVFLVNACQAFSKSSTNCNELDEVTYLGKPVSDMFVYTSQAPGFASFRNKLYGSWFVHCLSFVIMKMAKDSHLDEMVNQVKKILEEKSAEIHDTRGNIVVLGQAPSTYTHGSIKLLYFPIQP